MKIVIDTNVIISGIFFGGFPGKIINAVVTDKITACGTKEIIEEYCDIANEMVLQKHGQLDPTILSFLISKIELVQAASNISICRDPDDNKFLECAKDSQALYIVSGDKDLLVLKELDNIKIITAKEFCDNYL